MADPGSITLETSRKTSHLLQVKAKSHLIPQEGDIFFSTKINILRKNSLRHLSINGRLHP